jgi:hypothetical protein
VVSFTSPSYQGSIVKYKSKPKFVSMNIDKSERNKEEKKDRDITSCRNISSPGYYKLSGNITGSQATCFFIDSNDVTLDCVDFNNWIEGNGESAAIYISKAKEEISNISIVNCNMTHWNFGVYSEEIYNSTYSNLTFSLPGESSMIVCQGGDNSLYENISSAEGGGFSFNHCTHNTIRNNHLNAGPAHTGIGLYFDVGDNYNNITNNSFEGYGIGVLLEEAGHNIFENDTWQSSGDIKFISWREGGSDYNSFKNCVINKGNLRLTTDYGDLHGPHNYNLFENLVIDGNISVIYGSLGNVFTNLSRTGTETFNSST